MTNLNLIIKREYISRIQKKSFLILTILMPVIFIGILFIPIWLSGIKDSEKKHIAIIDNMGKYSKHIQAFDEYDFEITDQNPQTLKAKEGKELFGILQITDDLSEFPKAITLYSENQAPIGLLNHINSSVSEIVKTDKLNKLSSTDNIDLKTINDIKKIIQSSDNIKTTTIKWDESGMEKETSTTISSIIGSVFTFVMYMFIMMYGAMVMNGVVEEKSNRIVEVMISSVKPFDLMMGKIIGIGLVGLTQLAIWIVLFAGIISGSSIFFTNNASMGDSNMINEIAMLSSVNWETIIVSFFLYFIGGYLIYSSIFAVVGAAVDNIQDTQQFVMPITLIFIFSFYAGIYSIQNPYGPLAFWCSLIPITSPIVMMVRIPFGVPAWQIFLSIVILYATIVVVVKFAAKIYRVGILMYGKKPSIKEIIKWFSYK